MFQTKLSVAYFCVLFLCVISCCTAAQQKRRAALGPYHMNRHMYLCIKDIIKGEFKIPYKDWTKFHHRCYMRWYRHKNKYSIEDDNILYEGRAIIVDEDKKKLLKKEMKNAKGIGAKRMYHRLKRSYVGMSERTMQRLMERSMNHQLLNKQFINKPSPRPISAKFPQERHQVDLMDKINGTH